jgi:hypothetical protein
MKMSMARNIQNGIKKKKEHFSSEAELRDLINSAASKSLKKFIQRLDSGEIPIDNISDFIRVIGAYKEINGIDEAMEGVAGTGALPELNMRTDKVLDEKIRDGKMKKGEEDRLDIMDMSADEMVNLIREIDIAQNKENEATF